VESPAAVTECGSGGGGEEAPAAGRSRQGGAGAGPRGARGMPGPRASGAPRECRGASLLCLLCLLACAPMLPGPTLAEAPAPTPGPGPAGLPISAISSCAPSPNLALRLRGGGALSGKRDGGRASVWQPRDISATAQLRGMRQKHLQAQREQTMELAREKARELARHIAGAVKVHAQAAPSISEAGLEGAAHGWSSADENGACSAIIAKGSGLALGASVTSEGAGPQGDAWRHTRRVHVYMPEDAKLRVLLEGGGATPPIALDFPSQRLCREMVVYQPRRDAGEECRIQEIVDTDGGNNDQTHPEASGGDACDNQTHDWVHGRGEEDCWGAGTARGDVVPISPSSPHADQAGRAGRPADIPGKLEGHVGPAAVDLAAAPMDMDVSE